MRSNSTSELEKLRTKILGAIRSSRRFWMTYRENTFGIASIIDLLYKKSFLEVLFFTNADVIEREVPVLKIYTPLEDEIDFSKLIFNPDFDEDGLVSPEKIIKRMRKIIRRELQKHLAVLNNEAELINKKYENYQVGNNPFNREIILYYPDFKFTFEINFDKYPNEPTFSFSKTLSQIISEKEFFDHSILKHWNQIATPRIYELIDNLGSIIAQRCNIDLLKQNSQHLVLKDVSIKDSVENISFRILRGKTLGIIQEKSGSYFKDEGLNLVNLFEAIGGYNLDFEGLIEIFGNLIQSLPVNERKRIFLLPQAFESRITDSKIRQAIQLDIKLEEISKVWEYKSQNELIREVLKNIGLFNKMNQKLSQLSKLDELLFSIGRALLQSATIIMFPISYDILERLDFEKFANSMNRIKRKFHVILIFYGPEEIVSKADQILSITTNVSKVGSFDDYLEELPQYGEIITIELNNPAQTLIHKLLELGESAAIFEERRNERYKIFLNDNPNKMIIKLTQLLGPALYSFKRSKASMAEYMEFFEKKM